MTHAINIARDVTAFFVGKDVKDIATTILSGSGLIFGAIGALFGLYQYYLGRVIEKAKFAAELTDKLYADADLATAWKFIEWHTGTFPLPARFSERDGVAIVFAHTFDRLVTAMSVENRGRAPGGYIDLIDEYRTPDYVPYVEILDRLFAFIENMYGYYTSNVVNLRHIGQVLYLIDRLDTMHVGNEKVFENYLAIYKSYEVIFMIEVTTLYLVEHRRFFIHTLARIHANRRLRKIVPRAESLLKKDLS